MKNRISRQNAAVLESPSEPTRRLLSRLVDEEALSRLERPGSMSDKGAAWTIAAPASQISTLVAGGPTAALNQAVSALGPGDAATAATAAAASPSTTGASVDSGAAIRSQMSLARAQFQGRKLRLPSAIAPRGTRPGDTAEEKEQFQAPRNTAEAELAQEKAEKLEIKARTMYEMVDTAIDPNDKGVKKVVFFTNAQATLFDASSVEKILSAFDLPAPNLVIRLMAVTGTQIYSHGCMIVISLFCNLFAITCMHSGAQAVHVPSRK